MAFHSQVSYFKPFFILKTWSSLSSLFLLPDINVYPRKLVTSNIWFWSGWKKMFAKGTRQLNTFAQGSENSINSRHPFSSLSIHLFILLENSGEGRFILFVLRITMHCVSQPPSPRVGYASLSVQWTARHYILHRSRRYARESYCSEILRLSTVFLFFVFFMDGV